MPIYVTITKSTNPKKKYTAIFSHEVNGKMKKIKTTHFGSAGMSDFTIHKDKKRRELYLNRHRKREDWNSYMTAGSLSRYLLWNKPTFNGSLRDFKKRFNLK
tara:strand:- start:1883 stop:2188 length:306 start_codon:yes stop_codon:yes gene_type:complete